MMHDDEDTQHFLTPALPVNNRVHLDLSREPVNGHEYLLRTRLEASRIMEEEDVSLVDDPEEPRKEAPRSAKDKSLGRAQVEGNEYLLKTRLEAVAAAERVMKKVERHNKVKKNVTPPEKRKQTAADVEKQDERNISPNRESKKKSAVQSNDLESEKEDLFVRIHDELVKNKSKLRGKFARKAMPLKDKKRCCLFCLGSKLYSEIYQENVKYCHGHLPLLSYVIHLEHEEVELLLQYLYEWYLNVGVSDTMAKWLYAVLACLECPVSKEQVFGMLESFYLSFCKGRTEDLQYPYQRFVESLMQRLSIKE